MERYLRTLENWRKQMQQSMLQNQVLDPNLHSISQRVDKHNDNILIQTQA